MNPKGEKSRSMNCILIVILLYLAIYCTTSGFVNLASPRAEDSNSLNDIRIIQNNLEQFPKNVDSEERHISNGVTKNEGAVQSNNLSNQESSSSNHMKTIKLPEFIGPNLRTQMYSKFLTTATISSRETIKSSTNYPRSFSKYFTSLSKITKRRFSKYTRSFEPHPSAIGIFKTNDIDAKYRNVIRTLMPNNTLNLARIIPYTATIFDTPTTFIPDSTILKPTKPKMNNSAKNMVSETTHSTSLLGRENKDNRSVESRPKECFDPSSKVGICDHLTKRKAWSYQVETNECFEFGYSGCGTSRNIFWNEKDCVMYCVIKQLGILVHTKDRFGDKIEYIDNKTSKYFIIDNEMDIPVDAIGIKKENEDISMDKSTKSSFDNEDETNNNEYDNEYFYDSDEYNNEMEKSSNGYANRDEEKFPPIEIDENTNDAEENLSQYDIDPMHLMPHWDRHNHVYTRDAKNALKKN